ncbi:MAG: 50S ribosomal protein L18 [Candidatus Paceibacterota bacterium]
MSVKKVQNRMRRRGRIRAKISGTAKVPRASVFRSNRHILVQLIDDEAGKTILSSKVVSGGKSKMKGSKVDSASSIGEMIAQKAKEAGISEIVFDRGGYKYHGRVKALAEGLRKGGLKF